MTYTIALLLLLIIGYVSAYATSDCETLARTESGWVCGRQREAQGGVLYASFRGIPYAKQPLGELRFKELQPAEPWDGVLNATIEGPVCYQHDVIYGSLMAPQGVSESCIHANVHVPLYALPKPGRQGKKGLPILVYIHGGGWVTGSGDADFNGPEFLMGKDVIVITFNYRLDVLGFLSLGTSKIPGNNGLRDALTLLRWVQRNARYFGGDPGQVTLAGQSAGSCNAHLLTLSPQSKGLFKRVWLMSGSGNPYLFTTSPAYAQLIATALLTNLGLNGTDYDTVHDQLVQLPIEVIHNASSLLIDRQLTTFLPVQEPVLPGVTAVITDDPENLLANGNGDDIPVVIGVMSNECQFIRHRLTHLNVVELYATNPLTVVVPHFLFTLPENVTAVMAEKIGERYFGEEATIDEFIDWCSDSLVVYPALKFVRDRAERGGAPVYLYKFSYEAEHSVIKLALNLEYRGATHLEDLNNILKVNSITVPKSVTDDKMKQWMSGLVANFVRTGVPSSQPRSWPAETSKTQQYQEIMTPKKFQYNKLSKRDKDMFKFFDNLQPKV